MRAVIVAEDANFWHHNGIDTEALKTAMEYNLSERKVVFGASTISQQTVKNLFLTSSRNPLRKWHELVLTFGMEQNVRKRRILEIYLNVAEFGRGIYGVEAASLHYWGVHASQLTPEQAAELAATLPAPVKNNPHTRTRFFIHHYRKILGYMNVAGDASPGK
jgi:monofunctional biosynthetic peptidoglycan transglycosylase